MLLQYILLVFSYKAVDSVDISNEKFENAITVKLKVRRKTILSTDIFGATFNKRNLDEKKMNTRRKHFHNNIQYILCNHING